CVEWYSSHRSTRYLGLPLGIGRSKKEVFDYILEAIRGKLQGWKTKLLSSADKEVLVKSVLQALPVFSMTCFKLPVSICKEISKLCAKFWWKNEDTSDSGIHWRKWDKITLPKLLGGLGFHDISLFNEALTCKQLWRVATNPELLVSRILKDRYFPNDSILRAEKTQKGSWFWNSWLPVLPLFSKCLRIEVRNGLSTRIDDPNW
ncbi:Ribonuclease H-like superfamily protein, partial [Striga hermonthica]